MRGEVLDMPVAEPLAQPWELAQEGVEVVRNMRADTDWTVWHTGISNGDYIIQYDSSNLLPFQEIPLR